MVRGGVDMRLRLGAALVAAFLSSNSAPAQQHDPYFYEAQRVFSSIAVEHRLMLQLLLTSAGHWPAVPNVSYSRRLFAATKAFQRERGLPPTGIISVPELKQLFESGSPAWNGWVFRSLPHPERGRRLWLPTGLDLTASRVERGVEFREARNRFRLKFLYHPGIDVQDGYAITLREMVGGGDHINYKVAKSDFFVVTGNQGRYHRYVRYHADGGGLLGFDMTWSTDDPPIYGSRLVTIVSGSLWSAMTGAPFPTVPAGRYPWENREPESVRLPTPPPAQTTTPPANPPPAAKAGSSGSGFFVTKAGHILTNAHVVEDCATLTARPDGGQPLPAQLLARDASNDLAVLKIAGPVEKTLALRPNVRLGEAVAAFGFPHSNILATTGNFTLGNVTALAGLKDDTRYLQISAPVQSGNSGGPLVDGAGAVVGVVSAKLNALRVMAASGDLPQNVNFAVKSSLAASFLEANQVAFDVGAAAEKLDPADLAEKAKGASVFISCS